MAKICTKCKSEIPDSEQLDAVAATYPAVQSAGKNGKHTESWL